MLSSGTGNNRANTVDTSSVISSNSVRSSIGISNRSSSSLCGGSSNNLSRSSIGVLHRSNSLSRSSSSNILNSRGGIRISSISYRSSSIGDWSSNRFHVNIGLSLNFFMDIRFSSNLIGVYWLNMDIWLSFNFLMHIGFSSNLLMNIWLSSNFICFYRLNMDIWFSSNLLMDIRNCHW